MLYFSLPIKQVTYILLGSKPTTLTKNSKNHLICSFLKYSPILQLPSISKKVVCLLSPTSSKSLPRKQVCESTSFVPLGCFSPKRYGSNGCIPLPVNKVVGSSCKIKGARLITTWLRLEKYSK